MKTNHILIDVENVGLLPSQLSSVPGDGFHVHLFLNEQTKSIPVEVWQSLQPLGERVHVVRMHGTGPNALDFHIAFHLGRLSNECPADFFHIISKDKGFDPLVAHMKDLGVFCDRKESIAEIPILQPAPIPTPQPAPPTAGMRANQFLEKLKNGTRPRKWATLRNHLSAMFSALPETGVDETIEELKRRGVKENGARITYPGEP